MDSNAISNVNTRNPIKKGNETKKLIKRGFINYRTKNYGKDVHSSKLSTNKCRLMRLLFLAYQLERDFNAELLIFGYFPNEDVGSCGCWSFGKTTKTLINKADTKNYLKYWEKVFSQIEAKRQKYDTCETDCHNTATQYSKEAASKEGNEEEVEVIFENRNEEVETVSEGNEKCVDVNNILETWFHSTSNLPTTKTDLVIQPTTPNGAAMLVPATTYLPVSTDVSVPATTYPPVSPAVSASLRQPATSAVLAELPITSAPTQSPVSAIADPSTNSSPAFADSPELCYRPTYSNAVVNTSKIVAVLVPATTYQPVSPAVSASLRQPSTSAALAKLPITSGAPTQSPVTDIADLSTTSSPAFAESPELCNGPTHSNAVVTTPNIAAVLVPATTYPPVSTAVSASLRQPATSAALAELPITSAPTQSPVSAIAPVIVTRPASLVVTTTLTNVAVVPVPVATPLPTLALVSAKTLDSTSKCKSAFTTARQYATCKRRKTIDSNQQGATKAKTTRFLQEQIPGIPTPAALSIIPAIVSVGVPEPAIRKSTRNQKRKSFADELKIKK